MPIRLLGVRLTELTSHALQGSLFDNPQKKKDLYKAIDDVKNKYGRGALQKARTVKKNE
jgi:DNA polymerase-4